jgi:hypothetical protein
MLIGRHRWLRRVLVAQPLIAWPCSWLLWAAGGAAHLAGAVIVLWSSTILCVTGIIAPQHNRETRCR